MRLIGTVLAATLAAVPASADVVRLTFGADRFGQGWMFLDTDAVCKVVTAGHVVSGVGGRVRQPLVIDRRGVQWVTGPPIVLSDTPDIAVLPIPAAIGADACGEGRLSTIGVARRIANLTEGVLRRTNRSEVVDVRVARRAAMMDAGAGELFNVAPLVASDIVVEGWSGSVVLDEQGPLGIVFEVDALRNEARVVRVDVIRRLMAQAAATRPVAAPGTKSSAAIAVLFGTTADLERGPQLMLAGGEARWQVAPQRNTVAFMLRFVAPTQVRRVSLTTAPADMNRMDMIDISTQAEVSALDWTPANACPAAFDGRQVNCRFLARTVTRVRVLVKMQTDQPVNLGGFTIE